MKYEVDYVTDGDGVTHCEYLLIYLFSKKLPLVGLCPGPSTGSAWSVRAAIHQNCAVALNRMEGRQGSAFALLLSISLTEV